jgi:hypothetical protein
MNERIKELAEQAGLKFSKDWGECYTGNVQIERFAELVRQDEREVIADEFFNCLQSDLEHGVKCLNETAASNFEKQYPALSKFCDWVNEGRTE